MDKMTPAFDLIGKELKDLLEASDNFRQYREITTSGKGSIEITGTASLQINSRHPLGLSLFKRA